VILGLAVVGSMLGGMAFANVVQIQGLTQEGQSYSVSTQATPSFPSAPSVQLSTIPNTAWASGGCTGASIPYPGTAANNYEQFVFIGLNGTSCGIGDAVELFVFSSPANLPKSETVTISATVVIGDLEYQAGTNVIVSGGSYPSAPELQIFLDVGKSLPAVGIASLGLTLT